MPEAMRAEPAMIPNAPVAMACALSALVGTAAASTGQPRYDVAQVVRVEPIVEYTTYPVQREHCYQQPETVVAYAQPYPPAYPPAYAGPSYGIGVSYGGYGGHGHGHGDRKSVVQGMRVSVRVDLGGSSSIKKKKKEQT